jgi:hypothetical protein
MLFPPTNLTLVSKTTAQAVLSWLLAPQASTYNVYRDNVQIASGVAALTYTDASVIANKRYAYDVAGVVGGVETPRSNRQNVDIETSANLNFQVVYQEMPGEGGYPDVLWRWM